MISKEFLLAGRATFTLDAESDYYTFHVWRKRFDERGPTRWSVSQETRRGRYIGEIEPTTGELKLTARSWLAEDDLLFATLQIVLDSVWQALPLPDGWTVAHAGKCGACGRMLTTPESLGRAMGPACWGKRNVRRVMRTDHRQAA